jgi:hypothetical protein
MMLSFLLAQASVGGPKYLYYLLAWLIGAALGGYLSERKGYGDKPGLVSGLVLSLIGGVIWLFVPARDNSDWKIKGPWGNKRKDSPA